MAIHIKMYTNKSGGRDLFITSRNNTLNLFKANYDNGFNVNINKNKTQMDIYLKTMGHHMG